MGWFNAGGSRGPELSDAEWNQRLLDGLAPLRHVVELRDFAYQQEAGRAIIDGVVVSDTEDHELNVALLEAVGHAILEAHRGNHIRRSRVRVHVRSPCGEAFEFSRLMTPDVVTLEHLADHYGRSRHG